MTQTSLALAFLLGAWRTGQQLLAHLQAEGRPANSANAVIRNVRAHLRSYRPDLALLRLMVDESGQRPGHHHAAWCVVARGERLPYHPALPAPRGPVRQLSLEEVA